MRRKIRPYEATDVRLFAADVAAADPSGTNAEESAVLRHSSRLTMRCRLDTFGSSSFAEDPAPTPQTQRRHSHEYALQSHPFKPRCDYAAGVIIDGAIHMTPISTIQQFTPVVAPSASPAAAHRVPDAFVSAPTAPIVPGLAISDRIHREMRRQRSATLNAAAAAAAEWLFFASGSVESAALRRRLLSPTHEAAGWRAFGAAADRLFPAELLVSGGVTGGEGAKVAGAVLRRYADRHEAAALLRVYLRRCEALPLEALRGVLRGASGAPRMDTLRDAAVWAHGVWVAKTSPRFGGVAAALREWVLCRFYESADGALRRAELHARVGSGGRRALRDILESLATLEGSPLSGGRVWRLRGASAARAAADAAAHPQEIAFQRMQWEKLRGLIDAHLPAIRAGQAVARLVFAPSGGEGGAEMAALTASAMAAAALNRTHAANSAVPGAAGALAAASGALTEEDVAPIVRFVRRLFHDHGVLNKQRAKEMVLKAKSQHFPEATNAMLSAALQRCVQPFTNATWVLKLREEPEVDRHRPLIIETALELVNFEIRAFHARFAEKRQQASGSSEETEEVVQKIVPRVLSEIAVYKPHERLWHLKSGNVVTDP